MDIQAIGNISKDLPKIGQVEKNNDNKFGNIMTEFIGDVNKSQNDADKMTRDYVKGENNIQVQDVMIAAEKAKTSLQLLMEIRNKTVDMYKELTRIPV
jgi:flagellar hook-basal body complex protein FliE